MGGDRGEEEDKGKGKHSFHSFPFHSIPFFLLFLILFVHLLPRRGLCSSFRHQAPALGATAETLVGPGVLLASQMLEHIIVA